MKWYENAEGENLLPEWGGNVFAGVAMATITHSPLAVASALKYKSIGGAMTQSSNGEFTDEEQISVIGTATGSVAGGIAIGSAAAEAFPAAMAGRGLAIAATSVVGGFLSGVAVSAIAVGIYDIIHDMDPTARNNSIKSVTEELSEQFPNVPIANIERMVSDARDEMQNRGRFTILEMSTYDALEYAGVYERLETENARNGPSAGAPGRPGPINHATGLPELTGTGYIGPQSGNPITSPDPYAEEGPVAMGGGGGGSDPGTNALGGGPSGNHVPGSQHPGNNNGIGNTGGGGSTTGNGNGGNTGGNYVSGNRGGNGSTVNRTPPGNVSTHDPYENGNGAQPIIFDLDGNGIQITELTRSTIFVDGGDGLQHRTAWAGVGDGVLFFDPDGTGEITERRQYVFTDWDPTAGSDIEALASVFDINGDGVLTSDELNNFRIMVTNPDGSTTSYTLAELGITSINLTADVTHIELPDGTMITGQTTFMRHSRRARNVE